MNLVPVLTLLLIIQVFEKVDCLVQPHVCAKCAVPTELSKREVVQCHMEFQGPMRSREGRRVLQGRVSRRGYSDGSVRRQET